MKEGDLKIWHIPQIPGKAFKVPVASIDEALKLLVVLGNYDSFQFENNIKPDYANISGLVVFEDGEWLEWIDEETGDSISDKLRDYEFK